MGKTPAAAKAEPSVQSVPIGSLSLDPANVRRHPERNLNSIKASLARFGQQTPIVVDENNIVRKGNGTLLAAIELGWPTILAVRTTLKGSEATAFSIADNQTGLTSEWDYQGLGDLVRALKEEEYPLEVLGFADYELEPLLAADWTPPTIEPMPGNEGSGSPDDPHARAIIATDEEWAVVTRTMERVRVLQGDATMPGGKCLALICASYGESTH